MTSLFPSRTRVSLLVDDDAGALARLLAHDLPGTVYLRSMAHEYSVSPTDDPGHGRFYGAWKGADLIAVGFVGNSHNLTTFGEDSAMERLLEKVERSPVRPQLFVGPEEHARPVRAMFSRMGFRPRLDRRQYSYILDQEHFVDVGNIDLSVAEPHVTLDVVNAHAAMIEEDLNIPRSSMNMARLEAVARRRIREGRIWTFFHEDTLVFKTEEISRSKEGVLVGGVYTDPSYRGRGYAQRGMATWAKALFASGVARLALHVDAQNPPAIHAYEAVGFKRQGNLRLILCM